MKLPDTQTVLGREVVLPSEYRLCASGPEWSDVPSGKTMLRLIHKSRDTGPVDRFISVLGYRVIPTDCTDDQFNWTVADMVAELVLHDVYERTYVNGKHPVEPHIAKGKITRLGQFADQ